MDPKRSAFIRRYIAMRREKRNNERQHARCIGYVDRLINRLRAAGVTEQLP
jgi:hypothetical protein